MYMTFDEYRMIKGILLGSIAQTKGIIERESHYGRTKNGWELSLKEQEQALNALTNLYNSQEC